MLSMETEDRRPQKCTRLLQLSIAISMGTDAPRRHPPRVGRDRVIAGCPSESRSTPCLAPIHTHFKLCAIPRLSIRFCWPSVYFRVRALGRVMLTLAWAYSLVILTANAVTDRTDLSTSVDEEVVVSVPHVIHWGCGVWVHEISQFRSSCWSGSHRQASRISFQARTRADSPVDCPRQRLRFPYTFHPLSGTFGRMAYSPWENVSS